MLRPPSEDARYYDEHYYDDDDDEQGVEPDADQESYDSPESRSRRDSGISYDSAMSDVSSHYSRNNSGRSIKTRAVLFALKPGQQSHEI